MAILKIIQAKPNPAGKDKSGNNVIPAQQLAGEWIDIINENEESVSLNDLEVYHFVYKDNRNEWEKIIVFTGSLPSKEVVRVHSGGKIPINQMLLIDRIGADYHVFTGKNYIWNNDRKDYPRIWNPYSKKWIDKTYYDKYPPEGVILKRKGDKLVPL